MADGSSRFSYEAKAFANLSEERGRTDKERVVELEGQLRELIEVTQV